MAKIETRHRVDAHDGSLFVRLSVCVDNQVLKAVQGPLTIEQARRFRDDLTTKITEAECQPQSPAVSSAKQR